MAFRYDENRLTPKQIELAYSKELSEYRREEEALENLLKLFENMGQEYQNKEKIDEIRVKLGQVRFFINNLEIEQNILTL